MENNNSQRHSSTTTLLALLLFVVALLGAVLYVKPLWDDATSLGIGRDEKAQQKQQVQQQLTDLQKVQQQLNQGSEVSKETSLSAIPEKLEEDKLITNLADISRKNDITLNGVNFGIPVNAGPGKVAKVSVNANLTGTESALIGFLRGVEASSRKLVVRSITVQLGTSDTGTVLASFNVTMETYYQGVI